MFILVCEGNTYNLLVQRNYFQKQSPIAPLQSVSCKCAANLQEETHTEMWFQKKLRGTSAWVLYCKFAGDLQNTFLEEHLWGLVLGFISFVLVQVINNTFYWLAFIICRPEFVDWSKAFLKVFFILWYNFRNNFPNGRCNWSTYYIFISIFCQTNVLCNCRSSPPQLFFKKDHLIYTCYKCEEE